MSLSHKTRNRVRAVAALGLSAAVLVGCGSARPGVAFDVAGQTTSLQRVDAMSAATCEALRPQLQSNQVVLPMSQVRTIAVANMLNGEIADLIGAEKGLKPSAQYEERRAFFEDQAKMLDEDMRDDYVDINTVNSLYTDLLAQYGAQLLADAGKAEPTEEEITKAGTEAFRVWATEHEIEIDPRFGVAVVDGVISPRDDSLSVPVSDAARTRANDETLAYAASLPEDQVCR